ncbi:hypothetical protein HDV02_006221 [Globomyces sp. JEL0801]|nr:hypothetical protein HDV02_006221 [Globomyces sp. JEL0801]
MENSHWITKIGPTKWITENAWKKQLVNDAGTPILFLVFGTIQTALCGTYGDYVPLFKDSFNKANMKWLLRSPEGHSDSFRKQLDAIETLCDSISADFKTNGISKHRPVKTMAEVELRCKLVKRRPDGTLSVKPNDLEGQKHWSLCFEKGFEPNTLPNGVYSYEGQKAGFADYEKVLCPGSNVVATCRLQAAMFNNEAYVQLVPSKIQVFGSEIVEMESVPDIF